MSLKIKVSLLVSGLLLVAMGAATGVLLWHEQRALMAEMRRVQAAAVESLAEVCRDAAVNDQTLSLFNYLRRLKGDPEVREAMCLGPDGEVWGHTDVARAHERLDDPRARAVLAEEAPSMVPGESGGRRVLDAAAPVRVGPRRVATARVLYDEDALRDRFRRAAAQARRRILGATVPVLLLGFAGAFILTALVLRPLNALVEGVRTVAAGRLDHRIPDGARDEVGLLAGEFNRMAERLGELDRMKQDFVSSVTHDLKSPIAAGRVALDIAQRETEQLAGGAPVSRRLADAFLHIREGQERLGHLITSLLDVARIESALTLDLRPVKLEELADRVVRGFELIARQKGVALDLVVDAELPAIPADEAKLERAVANLVGNAVKFTERGRVEVRLYADEGGRQVIRVTDSGPGIPAAAREKLFSKFYRVAGGPKKEGTGLGLAIVKGFVEAHGGAVALGDAPGGGSVFTIALPKER